MTGTTSGASIEGERCVGEAQTAALNSAMACRVSHMWPSESLPLEKAGLQDGLLVWPALV